MVKDCCNWSVTEPIIRRGGLSSYYQAKKYCDVGSNSWRRKSEKLPQIDLDNFQMWTIFPQPSNNLFFFTKGVFSSAMISDKKEELSVLWHLVSVFPWWPNWRWRPAKTKSLFLWNEIWFFLSQICPDLQDNQHTCLFEVGRLKKVNMCTVW